MKYLCCIVLFHGTKNTDPYDMMKCEEGFDMRFSNKGMWGNGIYFAKQASYSHRYSYIDSRDSTLDIRQMFLAKVLIGDSYYTKPDNKIKIPPKIEGSEERYDSVWGLNASSKIYIVYDNGKSYPEYLIKYSSQNIKNESNSPFGSCKFRTKPSPFHKFQIHHFNLNSQSKQRIKSVQQSPFRNFLKRIKNCIPDEPAKY